MNDFDSDRRDPELDASPPGSVREVKFHFSRTLPQLLNSLGCSLLVSTYQAGKLIAVSAQAERIHLSIHNFEQAMGLAVRKDCLSVGTSSQVWFLKAVPDLAGQIEPAGKYDECLVARSAFVTGNIHSHEMAWADGKLWIVNTLFSCLSTLHDNYSFVPRWQPPFIDALAAEDRCHLNGLAMDNGRPRFVTAFSTSNQPGGWRPTKANTGCLIDIASGNVVAGGLCMPHSPRCHDGQLWVLESGKGSLATVDEETGRPQSVCDLPGYTRGLAFAGPFAFIGLSRIRETAVFGGVPIAQQRDELKCGIAVVDLRTGQVVATLQFENGVEEIFDVQILSGTRCPAIVGPSPSIDGTKPIWVVPNESEAARLG